MLNAGKEIELKMQLDAGQMIQLRAWLGSHAQSLGTTMQSECYFDNPKNSFYFKTKEGIYDALGSLRVRSTAKGDSVCYKYRHTDPVTGKTTHRDEYETAIKDGQEMIKLLQCLGYTDLMMFKKERAAFVYNNFEIVIDKAEGFGEFVEIELKKATDDVKAGIQQIYNFLKSLGITELKEFDRSYIHMKLNPGVDFGRMTKLS